MQRIVVFVLVCMGLARSAAADELDPHRKVIVLEYRSGSSAVPNLANRLATLLGQRTSLRVAGPDQTRVAYGDHLDQVIVRCAGDAACVARIGQKVGATEVILVAISELGDVILTIQRIDVGSHVPSSRIAETVPANTTPTDAQLDAYLTRLMPAGDFLRFGVIDIVANIAGASVTISGEKRGVTPIEPLRLKAPATYNIRIEKTGYVPYTTKVDLPPEGRIKVEADLGKRGGATAWYQHWYVLAAAGAIVAGAAGTSIYFATRDTSVAGNGLLHAGGMVN